MKYILLISVVCVIVAFYACKEEEEQPQAMPITVADIQGIWTISSFINEGVEIVDQFEGDKRIEIFANGDIFFPNTSTNVFGSWVIYGGDTLTIDIGTPAFPYNEFKDDWALINKTDELIELMDYDGVATNGDNNDADNDLSERVRLVRVQ